MSEDQHRKGGAPFGNTNGTAVKDPELRQRVYQEYCEHLAKGKSKRSWRSHIPGVHCTWQTIERYLEDELEFDPIKKEIAEADGYSLWEDVVADSAIGRNKDANTASLQMLMRNKYGWDRCTDKENLYEPSTLKAFDALMKQFGDAQDSSRKIDQTNSINE